MATSQTQTAVEVERSIGRIIKESSDLRHRLKLLSYAVVVAAGACAAFSIIAHETGLSMNLSAAVRMDCRSIESGPCLYHHFAPTKANQPPPPGGLGSYNWTLAPYAQVDFINNNTQASWVPRIASAAFPFVTGLPTVNALRAVASLFAIAAASLQLLFCYTLLDLETMAGASAQRSRKAAAARAGGGGGSVLWGSLWKRLWMSGDSMRVRRTRMRVVLGVVGLRLPA